jgi:CheY-like chemotaxis protein
MVSRVLPNFAPTALTGATIWIVEDERVSRRAMSVLLSASGYRTQAFGCSEDAIHALSEPGRAPRFALVDLDLPGMSGLEFIAHLERMAPTVVPILVTASDEDTLASRLRRHGRSVAYLRKPVNFEVLLQLLSEQQQALDAATPLGISVAAAQPAMPFSR